VILWTWEAAAPGSAGSGVCADQPRARRAAGAWMRAHDAVAGRVEQVRLATGLSLCAEYERTGITATAKRHRSGRISWSPGRRCPVSGTA